MEVDKQKAAEYGVVGTILLLLVSAVGGLYLNPGQLDNSFICSVNENVVLGVDHLSSTAKTVYWIDKDGDEQSKVCRNGYWLDLISYAEDHNLELNVLLQNVNEDTKTIVYEATYEKVKGTRYSCSSGGCVKLE